MSKQNKRRIHNGIKPWQYRETPYGRYYGDYDRVYEYNRWLATKYTPWEEQEKERRREEFSRRNANRPDWQVDLLVWGGIIGIPVLSLIGLIGYCQKAY